MKDRDNLIAFLALIVAIVILSAIGARTGKPTDLAIMTGLIGVLGTFRPRSATANVENADTVNQGKPE